MKIYVLTNCPYHDNERYYGAYSSEQKALEAKATLESAPTQESVRIISFEIDATPVCNAETEREP